MRKLILVLSILFFLFSLIFLRHYFSIFYFQNDLNKIVFNIEIPKNDDIFACFNKNCDKMNYQNGVYFYKLNQQNPLFYKKAINNIELISSKKTLENIKEIDLFVGHNYEKINLENKNISKVDFINKKSYSISFDIENNNKTIIQKLGIYFESIFYNWHFYLISYILFLVYLIKYQERFNFKIKHPIFLILFLAILLRLSHIDFVPLWNDELYTLTHISNLGEGFNLRRTFQDAGNPPIFFILSNIWLYFFHQNIVLIRLLPLIIGVVQVYFIYFILNKMFNKKIALIASFLSSINIFIILESNEIRSYILAMTLILAQLYLFYNLKNKFNFKHLILYCFISILLTNTHYYCIFYVLSNFILGLIIFKNKKEKIQFLICNLISFLSFVPYFIITFYSNSLNPAFNTWLEKPSIDLFLNHITFYFGNIFFFIITIIFSFFILKKLRKEEKFIFLQNIYSISFVFLSALIISLAIKPILFERYFCIFLPLLIINTSLILNVDFKTKFQPLIFCIIFLFAINIPKYENFNLFSNIDLMIQYGALDYKTQKTKSFFIISDKISYIKYYPKINPKSAIEVDFKVDENTDLINKYLKKINYKKGEKIILYLPEMCINSKIKFSKTLNLRKIETTIIPVYKIYIE